VDELKAALAGGDPIAREPGLSQTDADAMRRAIVAAATAETTAAPWPRPIFLAATVAATMALGLALGAGLLEADKRAGLSRARSAAAVNPGTQLAERRQLQFATPGGTRIIWVFDPEFNP
jgi:hypothetical protein